MEQNLYLKTKASTDSILTTNNLLHSISENNCMVLTNGAMTVKQCDFMTFIFKGLQIMVNNLNNTEVDEYMDFRDLDMEVTLLKSFRGSGKFFRRQFYRWESGASIKRYQ